MIERAVKGISYAVSKNAIACCKLIENGGLKFIFPLVMGRGLPEEFEKKKSNHTDRIAFDLVVISIISQLCVNLTRPSSNLAMVSVNGKKQSQYSNNSYVECRQRLLGKFIENDNEKINRCIELYVKFYTQVQQVEIEIQEVLNNPDLYDFDEDEYDEDSILAKVRY